MAAIMKQCDAMLGELLCDCVLCASQDEDGRPMLYWEEDYEDVQCDKQEKELNHEQK